jgi:hypothetical protein
VLRRGCGGLSTWSTPAEKITWTPHPLRHDRDRVVELIQGRGELPAAQLRSGWFQLRMGCGCIRMGLSTREDRVSIVPTPARRQASPALRDRFLDAIDRSDAVAVHEIALVLLGCGNSLPTMTCTELGLTPGSTYGDAAEAVTRLSTAAHPKTA